MGNRQKKLRLFNQGVKAARAINLCEDKYVCPLCAEEFDLSAIDDGKLTLEHVPAYSQGGRPILLTCRHCNSTAGHSIEGQRHLEEKQLRFVKIIVGNEVGFGGEATLTLGGIHLNAEIHNQGGIVDIRISKKNAPVSIQELQEYIERVSQDGTWNQQEFRVTSRHAFVPRKAYIADLKAGFLTLTAAFGYTYALSDNLTSVRNQISNPDLEILPRWWITSNKSHSIGISERDGIAIVSLGERAVGLPWISRADSRWSEVIASKVRITLRTWPWPKEFVAAIDLR